MFSSNVSQPYGRSRVYVLASSATPASIVSGCAIGSPTTVSGSSGHGHVHSTDFSTTTG